MSGSVLFGLVVFSHQLVAADEQPYTAFLKGTGATAVLMILLGLDSAFGRATRCRAASGMAIKRDGRSGGRSGRAAGGDPYAKLAQDNRLSHKSVERSLDRASRIAKQASRQAKNSKG